MGGSLEAVEASAAVRQLRRCTPGADLPPKLSGCSGECTPGDELPPALEGASAGVGLVGSSGAGSSAASPAV